MSLQKRKVVVIDDHPVVRAGLKQFIEEEKDLLVCGEADSAPSGFSTIEKTRPDLVILDIALKEGSGLDLIKSLKVSHPEIPILVISLHDESIYAERCIRAGARGYVMKSELADKLIGAIRKVLAGHLMVSDLIVERLAMLNPRGPRKPGELALDQLTDRELEVFRLLGQGRSVHEISEKLFISKSTVDTHRANIKTKLGINSAHELIARAAHYCAEGLTGE